MWLSVGRRKDGSKSSVPSNQFAGGLLQSGHIEWPVEVKDDRNVVDGITWIELIQKPQTLLGERQRCPLGSELLGDQIELDVWWWQVASLSWPILSIHLPIGLYRRFFESQCFECGKVDWLANGNC